MTIWRVAVDTVDERGRREDAAKLGLDYEVLRAGTDPVVAQVTGAKNAVRIFLTQHLGDREAGDEYLAKFGDQIDDPNAGALDWWQYGPVEVAYQDDVWHARLRVGEAFKDILGHEFTRAADDSEWLDTVTGDHWMAGEDPDDFVHVLNAGVTLAVYDDNA